MLYNNIISKMLPTKLSFAFIVIILNLHVIYCKSEENEFPNIDYSYIGNDVSEPNVCDVSIIARKLEMQDNNLKSKIKEAVDSAFLTMAIRLTSEIQVMANKNNNEMQSKWELLLENSLNNKIKEAIANDSTIANLTNVVQTMSEKLTKLENTIKIQTQNHTAPQTNNKGNETTSVRRECEADSSDSRLLHVTVPSSVRARTDVWKKDQVPDKDDLDMYMVNVTGCPYMACRLYSGDYQSVSNSPARGTWRRRLAVRGERDAHIRVTWDAAHDYRFYIGYNYNTQTGVYDGSHGTWLLQRATPGVMSRDKYSQFLYIQLEDGVMSFGALGESTPWWRHDVTVSAGDDVLMQYATESIYGGKLLVCE